jgi:carboxyl-terminal processing protease
MPKVISKMNCRLINLLSRLFLIGILGVAGLNVPAQQASPALPNAAVTEIDPALRRQETFEVVWKTVNQRFYDPKFGGVDWKAVHERYAPLVARANSDAELHSLLQLMVNELHQSHFFVIPPQAIPKILENDDPDDPNNPAANGPADRAKAEAMTPLERARTRLTRRLSTGIGIDLRVIEGAAVITRVDSGSNADRAGLRPGFEIKSVDGVKLSDAVAEIERNPIWHEIIRPELPNFLIGRYINGELKSSARLVYVDANNQEHEVEIPREKLEGEMSPAIGNVPPIYTEFETKQLGGGVGYIRFNAFAPILMQKVCAAFRSMRDAPGLIIDLRGNHGGLIGMIAGLSGLLEARPAYIGSMQTRSGLNPMVAYPQHSPYTGAVVVLVDGTSQSAAEMFAASLQEDGRAQVVGDTTAGNVIPSAIIKLPTGALFQYGFAKYLTPRGIVLEARGVIPDLIVKTTRENLLAEGDPQLTAGLKELADQIALMKTEQARDRSAPKSFGDPKGKATQATITNPPPPKPAPAKTSIDAGPLDPNAPTPKEVIEKYLQSIGGEAAFLKLTSRTSVGTVEITAMGVKGTAELFEQAPNDSALIMTVAGLGVTRQVSDGKSQWLQDPLAGLIRYPLALTAQTEDKFHREIALKKLAGELVFTGHAKIGERDALVLSRRFDSGAWERIYFDATSGLMLRRNNTYYEDYREVDGVKLPFITRDESPYGSVVLRMKEIKHNVPIEKNRFVVIPDCFTGPVQSPSPK